MDVYEGFEGCQRFCEASVRGFWRRGRMTDVQAFLLRGGFV
jgi:hypothetical protein